MSKLLEILGRAITVDTADLICNWFRAIEQYQDTSAAAEYRHLTNIVALIEDEKITAAQHQLRLLLYENPASVKGRLAAAAICLRENRLQQAIEQLNSVYMRQPSNTMALYALGHCYERLGQEAQAAEFYQDCLKFKNYLLLPRQRLAAIYFKNNQLEKTIHEYELLKTEHPGDIATLLTLGHLYNAAHRYHSAIDTFNTAILTQPDNFFTEDTTDQLVIDGQPDRALDHLDQLLAQQPERPDLLLKRADLLAMLGADDQAVSQYQHLISASPQFLEAVIKLGILYLHTQHDHLAAEQFSHAIEINDQIVDSYIGLAIAQKLAGRTNDALSVLSLAASIQPNSSFLFAHTAILQFKIRLSQQNPFTVPHNDFDLLQAVIRAHRAQISQSPENPDAYYRLGILLTYLAQFTDAIAAFRTALDINPTHTSAKSKLALCLFETGQKNQALDQITSHNPLTTDTLELHYKIALLYCNRLKFASSLINLENHLKNNFTSADATVNISIVLQNLGLLDRATALRESLNTIANTATKTQNTSSQDQF